MQLLNITEPTQNNIHKDKQKITAIGIDLGTTNSLVAFSTNQQPLIIANSFGEDVLPSIVFIDDKEQIKTGNINSNISSIRSIKRLFGKSFNEIQENQLIPNYIKNTILKENDNLKVRLGKKLFTPEEISSYILKTLKQTAEDHFGYAIDKAVITIPSYFDDHARNATIFAAKLANLDVIRLVSEPTAAAYAYGLDKGSEGYFLVYDLGGGTFDVSLLNMQMGVFQVLATGGNTMLGGDDIDHILYNYFEALLQKDYNIAKLDEKTSQDLLKKSRYVKEALTNVPNASFTIDCEGNNITLDISLISFEKLISPLIDQTIQILNDTIERSNIAKEEIEGVILVGGSTRIRLIKHRLVSQLGFTVYDDVDPDRVVALGAALQAENLSAGSDNLLIDVTPLSLGLELMGGIVEKLIVRNTPIPCSVVKEFTTYADNQTGMQFHVVQGDREIASDCRSLVRFELLGIPPMKGGCATITVTFTLDADGILFITAIEKTTQIKQDIILKPAYGLNPDQMQQMLVDAFQNMEADFQTKLLRETIVEAKRAIEVLNNAIEETHNILDSEEYFLIKEQIQKLEHEIKQDDREQILSSLEQLEKVANEFITEKMSNELTKALQGQKV